MLVDMNMQSNSQRVSPSQILKFLRERCLLQDCSSPMMTGLVPLEIQHWPEIISVDLSVSSGNFVCKK
jgi:hypothetical protein